MASPISVTITNRTDSTRELEWLPKGYKRVSGRSTTTVDYEPWSCASDAQRALLVSEIKEGKVELELHIRTIEGRVLDIRYDPAADAQETRAVRAVAPGSSTGDQDMHIVIAGTSNMDAIKMGVRVSRVDPPRSNPCGNPSLPGFRMAVPGAQGRAVGEEPKPAIAMEKEAAAPATPKEEPAKEPDPLASGKAEFDALVSRRRWKDAFACLRNLFGDKVTFNYRTVISMKDFDAIVRKYSLA